MFLCVPDTSPPTSTSSYLRRRIRSGANTPDRSTRDVKSSVPAPCHCMHESIHDGTSRVPQEISTSSLRVAITAACRHRLGRHPARRAAEHSASTTGARPLKMRSPLSRRSRHHPGWGHSPNDVLPSSGRPDHHNSFSWRQLVWTQGKGPAWPGVHGGRAAPCA